MDWSLLFGCIAGGVVTVFLYRVPRSARFREQQRAMAPRWISAEAFRRVERINEFLGPLVGALVTIGLCIKFVTEAF